MHPWGKAGLGKVRTEGAVQGTRLCGFIEHWDLVFLLPRELLGQGLGYHVILSHICFSQTPHPSFLGGDRGSYGEVLGSTSEHTGATQEP